jgi:hypothetical protein
VLFLITHAERIPEKFLKHIEGQKGLYEIRIEAGSNDEDTQRRNQTGAQIND